MDSLPKLIAFWHMLNQEPHSSTIQISHINGIPPHILLTHRENILSEESKGVHFVEKIYRSFHKIWFQRGWLRVRCVGNKKLQMGEDILN